MIAAKRIIIITLIVGLLLGGLGGYKIAQSASGRVNDPNKTSPEPSEVEKNLYDGSSLTLVEMYDSLQNASGSDFDQKLLAYEISIKQNEAGMLRLAKEKTTQESMKKYAQVQMDQNDDVAKMLFDWQIQWGFSHH